MSDVDDEIDKVLDEWFYKYTTKEPDDTETLVLHETYGWESDAKPDLLQAITTLLELQYKKGIEYGKLIQLNKTNGVIYNGITYRKGDLAALEGDK